jgi:hypothetical protein
LKFDAVDRGAGWPRLRAMLSAMDRPTALERAFELARSGAVTSIPEIVTRLRAEGLDQRQIEGRSLTKQLKGLIVTAQDKSMPKGPKGEKRPADAIARAVKIARIATGEIEEDKGDDGKDKAAQSLGRRGGRARAVSTSPERRAEIARKAAKKRWEKRG